jgi:hypothetical protein
MDLVAAQRHVFNLNSIWEEKHFSLAPWMSPAKALKGDRMFSFIFFCPPAATSGPRFFNYGSQN